MSDPLYITIAGIKRSGSTWLANAVRIICEEAGLSVWMGEHRPDVSHHPNEQIALDGWPEHDVVINKIHPFIREVADRSDYVFSSYRDINEVWKSWNRFRGGSGQDLIYTWCFWHYQWRPYVDYEAPYERILRAKQDVIYNIFLQIRELRGSGLTMKDIAKIEKLMEEVKPPTDKDYDPKTLMFSNHITSK